MTPDQPVERSRRLYSRLLRLYPQDFRSGFGDSMLQLFTDQCRSAVREKGPRGMIALWTRTLTDLAFSVVREHLASPNASGGLLEAVPNKPLPWKGVVLVLLPCLVFFYGQIEQLAGRDFFFLLIYRAGYFLIIPVAIVGLLKRKFPVWGLIPLGIFYRTLFGLAYRFPYGKFAEIILGIVGFPHSPMAFLYPTVKSILLDVEIFLLRHSTEIQIFFTTVLLGSVLFLIIHIARRSGLISPGWVWMGIFVLLTCLEALSALFFYWYDFQVRGMADRTIFDIRYILHVIADNAYDKVTLYAGFLLLILIGAILVRRHGRLTLLLPLGYIIPTVVLGRFDETSAAATSLIWISLSVLAYRFLVTLIAPIWIVRSATGRAQTRAGSTALPAAVAILLISHIGDYISYVWVYERSLQGLILYYSLSPDLIVLAGIALAVVLYGSAGSQKAASARAALAPESSGG